MQFIESDEFKKEFAKLSKKYRTLPEDFERLLKLIKTYPSGGESRHAPVLKREDEKVIVKRRMFCRATIGSNFRVIYFYDGEKVEILFIEIYFKGKKENENRERIEKLWKERVME